MHGLTANSFSSVSLDPPLVLWSQATSAGSHSAFKDAERFTINILAEHQYDLANHFATRSPDKFSGIDYDLGVDGLPLLRDCSAWLECKVVSRYPGGDHVIFVGSVDCITPKRAAAAGIWRRAVSGRRPARPRPSRRSERQGAMKSQPHAVRLASRAMLRLAHYTGQDTCAGGVGQSRSHGDRVASRNHACGRRSAAGACATGDVLRFGPGSRGVPSARSGRSIRDGGTA